MVLEGEVFIIELEEQKKSEEQAEALRPNMLDLIWFNCTAGSLAITFTWTTVSGNHLNSLLQLPLLVI